MEKASPLKAKILNKGLLYPIRLPKLTSTVHLLSSITFLQRCTSFSIHSSYKDSRNAKQIDRKRLWCLVYHPHLAEFMLGHVVSLSPCTSHFLLISLSSLSPLRSRTEGHGVSLFSAWLKRFPCAQKSGTTSAVLSHRRTSRSLISPYVYFPLISTTPQYSNPIPNSKNEHTYYF